MGGSRNRWKRQERQISLMFGTSRNYSDGTSHTDAHTDRFAIEVKTVKELPQWLTGAVQQAVDDARGLTPIAVFSEVSRGKKARRVVVIRIEDFIALVADPALCKVVGGAVSCDEGGRT